MKKLLLFALAALFLSSACNKRNHGAGTASNKVLLIKIDYLTHEFEGGKELSFNQFSPSFSTTVIDTPAADFGSVKIMYSEINQPLFYGTIVWMGLGERKYPESLMPPSAFTQVLTNDLRMPLNGFENIYPGYMPNENYEQAWVRAQAVGEVRTYLDANPDQVVKALLYTPSVGAGDLADWDWYFMLKN